MMRSVSNPWLRRALLGCALLLLPAALHAQLYPINGYSPKTIPAGSPGASIVITGPLPGFSTNSFGVCFYTGYGASATPIIPPAGAVVVVTVPASTIQQIPPASFVSGTFFATMYVADATVPCTGTPNPAISNNTQVPIVFPTLNTVVAATIPQKNPAINTQPPPYSLIFTGNNFLANTLVTFTWSGGSGTGAVKLASTNSVVEKLPTTIPAALPSISATLCNTGPTYSYCATSKTLNLSTLAASTATLTATPNPATVQQNVLLAAQFKTATAAAGAPTGTATFTSGTTTLGTAPLLLDKTTGAFYSAGTGTGSAAPVTRMLTADLNADGIPDVLYFDSNNGLHVLLGTTPFGAFQPEILVNAVPGCGFVNSFAIGDVNGDGYPDVVVSCGVINSDNFAAVMQGNGDGTFATAVALTGVYGSQVALADMDRDGVLDLITGGPTAAAIVGTPTPFGFQVFKGKGNGTFSLNVTTATPFAAIGNDLLVADLDKDGYPDIIELKNLTQNVQSIDVYASKAGTSYGAGSAAGTNPTTSIALANYPQIYTRLIAGDFNGDGLLDLGAYGSDPANTIVTALNTSKTGAISFAAPRNLITALVPSSVQTGDFNGDGFADLAVASTASGAAVYDSDGAGGFGTNYTGLKVTPTTNIYSALASDINSDGDADLLLLTVGASNTTVLTGYLTTGAANASFTTNYATSGTPTVAAAWPGNINITGSSPSISLPVLGAGTSTSIGTSLTPTVYGQPVMFSSSVTSAATGTPSGTITFKDGGTQLAPPVTLIGGSATLTLSTLAAGTHNITAVYSGDTVFATSTSPNTTQIVNQAQPVITWNPVPTNITYGTTLVAGQLNATAASTYFATVPGNFNYNPGVGAGLGAGTQTLNVNFTPTDTNDFKTATGTATITIAKFTPVVTWNAPTPIVVGTPLSATQLNATATGASGALVGGFTYTPPSGTVLAVGPNQPLSVLFTPMDLADYTTATANTTITVIPLAITTVAPNTATLGAAATPITLTGTGFLPNSVVNVNGTPLATYAYVNATTMTAVIPTSYLSTAQVLNITVFDPTQIQTSGPVTFTIGAPPVTAVFTGPSTTQPAQQPAVSFALTNPYPIPLSGTITLTFANSSGASDPALQFASGGRTTTFTIPANATATPSFQLQSGTDAGTITATLVLTAAAQVVTPANIVPLQIVLPPAPPVITSMTLTRGVDVLTVNIIGYSDTRDMTQAAFHFTPASGQTISNPDITLPAAVLFSSWYGTAPSQAYGSNFLYSQTFDLTADQSTVGSVTVTLTNSAGASASATAQ